MDAELDKYLVYQYDKMKLTPLHWAVKHHLLDMTRLLLDHNADPNKKDSFERTPLLIAVRNGNLELVMALIENFASPFIKSISGQSSL